MKPEELSKYRQVASHVVSAAMRDGHSKTLLAAGYALGNIKRSWVCCWAELAEGRGSSHGDLCWGARGTGSYS